MNTSSPECVLCKFKSDCFQVLSEKQLEKMSGSKLKIHYNKGETIQKQGSYSKGILYLSKGYAKVYREIDGIGTNCIVAVFKPGQMVGLSGLFTARKAPFTVVAMTDCTVCCIEIETFQRMMMENLEFTTDIIKSINEQNSLLFDYQISNNHKQLNGRLAEAILYLQENVFESEHFEIPLSRKDLAEYTNMSTMSVVRILKSFKDDQILDEIDGRIKILDGDKLRKIRTTG